MEIDQEYPPGYVPHIGQSRQYWRDIILGVNDGLVSIFLLVVGVVSGGLSQQQVLLTATAGAIAGAVSMAAGEYLATKSQDEVLDAELELEQTHIRKFREMELGQLRGFFTEMGVEDDHLDGVMAGFVDNDEALLNAMGALEFGIVDSERRSPYRAMAVSGGLFVLGSLPSVLPFAIAGNVTTAMVWATLLSLIALFAVGVVKAYVARTSWIRSGFENLIVAGVGGAIAWAIGRIFDANVA
ncbi:MAG TPA: VIT1/CCC1 transporter family protein [Acidimicrobiia bacterium]|nr:VIT1/CCC1 transporter family protein [Acidimicrobiia bacterium]